MALNSSVFWVITRSEVFETDVSGLTIGDIFKGQAVQEEGSLTLEDGTDR
jgi:hypothetical protein